MGALKEILAKKTDDQLRYYVANVDKHTEEAVCLALEELKRRNAVLPEVSPEIPETRFEAIKTEKNIEDTPAWKGNVVSDADAREYYSQSAIYTFSILFSVFFGTCMLAVNCKNARKPIWPVMLFGIFYTGFMIYILEHANTNTAYTFIGNALGASVSYEIFWKKHLRSETHYRVKPIWIPLIIALCISVPIIVLIILATK